MKKMIYAVATAIIALFQFAVLPANAAVQPLDGIVAVVNSQPITESQLDQAMHDDKLQLQAMSQPVPPEKAFRAQVLQRLIDINIQLQIAKRNNITVSDQDVENAIARIARGNGLDVNTFYSKLAQGGITKARYLQQIKQQMIISKLQSQWVSGQINVTDAQAKQYIADHSKKNTVEKYTIKDILLPSIDNASASSLKRLAKKAAKLKTDLENTTSAAAAQRLIKKSGATVTDTQSQVLSAYPDIFMPAIKSLKQGAYSKVISAGNGMHILQLVRKVNKATKPALNLQQAKEAAAQEQASAFIAKTLKHLRATAFIKINN